MQVNTLEIKKTNNIKKRNNIANQKTDRNFKWRKYDEVVHIAPKVSFDQLKKCLE